MRLIVALDYLTGMNRESDDGRTPATLGCRYLHLIDEVAMSQMHPVKEADGGYGRGECLRICVSNDIHLFKQFFQILTNVIVVCMNA